MNYCGHSICFAFNCDVKEFSINGALLGHFLWFACHSRCLSNLIESSSKSPVR